MAYPISDVTRRIVYSGSAGVGPYSFSFEVLSATDIAVYKDQTLLTLTTDYTVAISGDGTGSVTLVVAATAANNITLVGARAIQRTTDFVTGGDLFANSLNDELDSLVIFAQQVKETADRGLKAPITDPTDVNMVLPTRASRIGKTLAFDASGNPTVGEDIGNWRGNWAAGTSYTVRDLVKDTANYNIYRCNTAHTASGSAPISSNADSAKWDLVIDATAVADAEAAQAAAEAAQAAAETAETNAQDWATKVDGIVDSTDYSAKAWSIGGTGVSDTASRGAAKEWATETSGTVDGTEYSAKEYAQGTQAGTGGSAKDWATETSTNVDGVDYSSKEYAVGTQTRGTIGSSKDWATYTGGTVNASEYSAKEYAVGTTATDGSAKEWATTTGAAVAASEYSAKEYASGDLTANGGSAKAWAVDTSSPDGTTTKSAKTWAGEASTSASNAAAAQAAAEAALASFNATYLGAQASDPTLDNEGDPVTAGDWYFNTSSNISRIYDGSAWSNVSVSSATVVSKTSSTGSAVVPAGSQAQRDGSPSAGYFRFNSDSNSFEGYNGSAWGAVGGGATGAGGDAVFYENGQTVTTSYTLTANSNAMSTGPITVNSGVTVTVPSGSRWVVL